MIVYCQYRTTVVTAQRPLPHLPADAKQPPPHNYHTLIGVMTAKVTYISRGVSTLSSVNLTASPPCCQSARYCLLHLFLSANNSIFFLLGFTWCDQRYRRFELKIFHHVLAVYLSLRAGLHLVRGSGPSLTLFSQAMSDYAYTAPNATGYVSLFAGNSIPRGFVREWTWYC